MSSFQRRVTTGSTRAATHARRLDTMTEDWLATVARGNDVRAAGRRAAHALVTVAGFDPQAVRPMLTVASDPAGVAHAAGVSRPDVTRGLTELRQAGYVTEDDGVLVLVGGER